MPPSHLRLPFPFFDTPLPFFLLPPSPSHTIFLSHPSLFLLSLLFFNNYQQKEKKRRKQSPEVPQKKNALQMWRRGEERKGKDGLKGRVGVVKGGEGRGREDGLK
jgi:hypothetical protein